MLTLSLAALAFLPSATALVRKDGVVCRLLLSKLTPKELLPNTQNRGDYRP